MNCKSEDEDYWNESDSKAFSFDEEEFSYKSTLFDGGKGSSSKPHHDTFLGQSSITDLIFEGLPTVKKQDVVKRPLRSLISKHSLSKIFGEESLTNARPQSVEEEVRMLRRQVENQWVPIPASRTIKCITLGQPYSFHLYRSLEQKTDLIDEAVKSGDGNAILAVVLYLSNTLKKSIFYQLLQDRPCAVAQYVQYLSTRHLIAELIDLLSMLGQTTEAAMRQFKIAVQGSQNKEIKLKKLNSCYQSHFSASDSKDKQFISSLIKYMDWILSAEKSGVAVPTESTLSSLNYICQNYWSEPKTSHLSPWNFASQQGVSDRQFQWTSLCARASLHAWDDIESLFLKKVQTGGHLRTFEAFHMNDVNLKGWIGGKKLNSVLSVEKVLQELHRQGAPSNVLAEYLAVVDNVDKKLQMSKQMSCHSVVIDIYVATKDRQGLVEYKANLKPQSEDYIMAENALHYSIKWKN